ncbi:MAG: hypothetical protein ACPGC2_00375 [Flavobacteriaceae bacterium]
MKQILLTTAFIFAYSCTSNSSKNVKSIPVIEDSKWVIDSTLPKGHIGRYGILPNTYYSDAQVKKVLEMNALGVELFFPNDTYDINLVFDSSKGNKIVFDNTTIKGRLYIIGSDGALSKDIQLLGKLKVLDKVFLRHAQNIKLETLKVISDPTNSKRGTDNPGVSIYAGVDTLILDSLFIENPTQNNQDHNKFSAAALQVHGWNNNPKNISIDYVYIKNSGRSAVYLTGENHEIGTLIIDSFGGTEDTNMAGLEDAIPGDEKKYKALWINKCNNCIVYEAEIIQELNENTHHLAVGIGDTSKPSIIEQLSFVSDNGEVSVLERIPSNVIVRNTIHLNAE